MKNFYIFFNQNSFVSWWWLQKSWKKNNLYKFRNNFFSSLENMKENVWNWIKSFFVIVFFLKPSGKKIEKVFVCFWEIEWKTPIFIFFVLCENR